MKSDRNSELLTAILDEVKLIRAELARLKDAKSSQSPSVARLVSSVWDAVGGRPFVACDLVDNAIALMYDGRDELHDALVHALGIPSVRHVGAFLSTHEGESIGGYVIRRSGRRKTREGVEWQLRKV